MFTMDGSYGALTRQLVPKPSNATSKGRQALARDVSSKRKNASTACNNCRLKRTKCTGGPVPCKNCAKLDVECYIDTASDQRKRAVTKARLEQLEKDQRLLNTLLETAHDDSFKNSSSHPTTGLQTESNYTTPTRTAIEDESDALPLRNSFSTVQTTLDTDTSANPSRLRTLNRYIVPGAARSFGNLTLSAALRANQYTLDIQALQLKAIHGRIESCLPLNTCIELDDPAYAAVQSVLSFQAAARSQITQGAEVRQVLSMDSFDLCLFYRDRVPGDGHTVANWACEWGKTWIGFPVAVRLSTVYFVGSLMRWLIMPCKETYAMMPSLMRPLPCQLLVPHPMDIDLWTAPPAMRAAQLLYGNGWLLRATSKTQRLDWQHPPDLCVTKVKIRHDSSSSEAPNDRQGFTHRTVSRFSSEFIACIEKAESWSVSRDLLLEMPELEGHVRFHENV